MSPIAFPPRCGSKWVKSRTGRFLSDEIVKLDAAHEHVAIEVDRVVDDHVQLQRIGMRLDARDQRIAVVVEPLLPRRIADPGELAVAPDAEKRDVAGGLVVLPDMRVVDVADVVLMIEIDHEVAVADGKVARHV